VLEGSVRDKAGTVSRFEVGWEEAHSKAEPKPPLIMARSLPKPGREQVARAFGLELR